MSEKSFADQLIEEIKKRKSYLCVGLDPQLRYFPPRILKWAVSNYGFGLRAAGEAIFEFNRCIIDATADNGSALCYKPQMAFYEKYGHHGVRAFERTTNYIKKWGMICIEDAKREDGGDTAEAYAEGHLGQIEVPDENGDLIIRSSVYDVDAITITPWIGEPNFKPFKEVAKREGKGIFVVDKTSFTPEAQLQELKLLEDGGYVCAWTVLARQIRDLGQDVVGENGYSSIGVVMGATYPRDAEVMRDEIPHAFKLVPGFGAQKGSADGAVTSINDDGFGIIVNNSRATNYAWLPKFSKEFACDPERFAEASAQASLQARNALNDAVERRIGHLPF